jgi:outer membrane receptor protein involved in Fe transport
MERRYKQTLFYNPSYIGQYATNRHHPTIQQLQSQAVLDIQPRKGRKLPHWMEITITQRLNPAIGFSFTPNDDKRLNIFGSYSESMRAPTAIELSCADPASPCALPTGFNGDPDLKAVVAKTLGWAHGV